MNPPDMLKVPINRAIKVSLAVIAACTLFVLRSSAQQVPDTPVEDFFFPRETIAEQNSIIERETTETSDGTVVTREIVTQTKTLIIRDFYSPDGSVFSPPSQGVNVERIGISPSQSGQCRMLDISDLSFRQMIGL